MSKDISKILEGWEYEPDDVMARIVQGDDGREKLQMRIDMGLMQMEMDGRPDGQRPEGSESWLDFYEAERQNQETTEPDAAPFRLNDEACGQLWREGVQYYHRYLSFWQLDRHDLCARDTARNLRLFAFVRESTDDDQSKLQFDQWRPYVTMMHTRSVATPLIERKEFVEALTSIESGIDAIRDFLEEYGQAEHADECMELGNLEEWREEILLKEADAARDMPQSVLAVLRRKLDEAIAAEEFEEAARLRDEIRKRLE